jgi:hypothetical protein
MKMLGYPPARFAPGVEVVNTFAGPCHSCTCAMFALFESAIAAVKAGIECTEIQIASLLMP